MFLTNIWNININEWLFLFYLSLTWVIPDQPESPYSFSELLGPHELAVFPASIKIEAINSLVFFPCLYFINIQHFLAYTTDFVIKSCLSVLKLKQNFGSMAFTVAVQCYSWPCFDFLCNQHSHKVIVPLSKIICYNHKQE